MAEEHRTETEPAAAHQDDARTGRTAASKLAFWGTLGAAAITALGTIAAVLLSGAGGSGGAPEAGDPFRAVIDSPEPDTEVRGRFDVEGTANRLPPEHTTVWLVLEDEDGDRYADRRIDISDSLRWATSTPVQKTWEGKPARIHIVHVEDADVDARFAGRRSSEDTINDLLGGDRTRILATQRVSVAAAAGETHAASP